MQLVQQAQQDRRGKEESLAQQDRRVGKVRQVQRQRSQGQPVQLVQLQLLQDLRVQQGIQVQRDQQVQLQLLQDLRVQQGIQDRQAQELQDPQVRLVLHLPLLDLQALPVPQVRLDLARLCRTSSRRVWAR